MCGKCLLFHEYKSAFNICSENIRLPNLSYSAATIVERFQNKNSLAMSNDDGVAKSESRDWLGRGA